MPLMTRNAYAKHRGVTRKAVDNAIESGRIRISRALKIDSAAADRDWQENTTPAMGKNSADTAAGSYSSFKVARAAYDAKQAKLDYEKASGKLIDVDAVALRWDENVRRVCDRLVATPDKLAVRLAAITDPREVRTVLMQEIVSALNEFESKHSVKAA